MSPGVVSLILVAAALAGNAAPAAPTAAAQRDPTYACTAGRLSAFVDPTGIHQSWPTASELPAHLANQAGLPFPDEGLVADGYQHSLVIDTAVHAAYVVQQGGIAGFRTIYGPLPVASCVASSTGEPPRGARQPRGSRP